MALAGIENLTISSNRTAGAQGSDSPADPYPVTELRTSLLLSNLLETEDATASPDVGAIFPWLHGINAANPYSLLFFGQKLGEKGWCNQYERPDVKCGLMKIKIGDESDRFGTLRHSFRLDDIFAGQHFRDRPINTLTIRDFASQPARYATVCDILVYSPCLSDEAAVAAVSRMISKEQNVLGLRRCTYSYIGSLPEEFVDRSYHILYDPFAASFRAGSDGHIFAAEQVGILHVTKASPIARGVWLGNGTDVRHFEHMILTNSIAYSDRKWNMFIECSANYSTADLPTLSQIDQLIRFSTREGQESSKYLYLKFPSFGALKTPDVKECSVIISICKLLYVRGKTNSTLIHSDDGYRCGPLLAVLYLIYSQMLSVEEALMDIQVRAMRPVSLHSADIEVLTTVMPLLHRFSPLCNSYYHRDIGAITQVDEVPGQRSLSGWLRDFQGSFPSKILSYLFLGSITEANNHDMLKEMGISRVISVGEKLAWQASGALELLHIDDLQDDGTDSLETVLPYVFSVLEESFSRNIPTLVNCRMGVSRSAAVCIAEVMRRLNYSLPEAYFHVRVRRLNVVIQPNLRLMYELLRLEEKLRQGSRRLRSADWPALCREIVALNSMYTE